MEHLYQQKRKKKQLFYYQYALIENNQPSKTDTWQQRSINLKKIESDEVNVIDDWQNIPFLQHVFNSRAFAKVFDEHREKIKEVSCKKSHAYF